MIFLNCKNKILGRICSIISKIIINFFFIKKKITFIIYNIEKILIKKNKIIKHSGYIGNIKIKNKKNSYVFKKCIFNMLSKNKSRKILMKKIIIL